MLNFLVDNAIFIIGAGIIIILVAIGCLVDKYVINKDKTAVKAKQQEPFVDDKNVAESISITEPVTEEVVPPVEQNEAMVEEPITQEFEEPIQTMVEIPIEQSFEENITKPIEQTPDEEMPAKTNLDVFDNNVVESGYSGTPELTESEQEILNNVQSLEDDEPVVVVQSFFDDNQENNNQSNNNESVWKV